MSTPTWSTIVHVQILDGSAPAGNAVRAAITRTFETLKDPVDARTAGRVPADWSFAVETAGRRFPKGAAPLAPPGSGPATVALDGDVDAVDRIAAVLGAAFATERMADDHATLTMRVHPETHLRPGVRRGHQRREPQ
jgi:hypothetical protein